MKKQFTTIFQLHFVILKILNNMLLFPIMYDQRLCDGGMARFGDHCSTIGTILLAELVADKEFKLLPNFMIYHLMKGNSKLVLHCVFKFK